MAMAPIATAAMIADGDELGALLHRSVSLGRATKAGVGRRAGDGT